MFNQQGTISVKLDSEDGAKICRALAAEQRVTLLSLLTRRAMNINEIAAALGVSQPTASVHIRVLEESGLVECEYASTGKGSEKRCWATFDKLVLEADSGPVVTDEFLEETAMPVGLFTALDVLATCGMAGSSGIIGFMDSPQSFLVPDRADAQMIWFGGGWIEYTFPCNLPPTADITGVELLAEVCSEAPNYDNEWPSDITVWINGVEVGTWTSPGDFGGRRGKLNPDWWNDSLTQYGALKSWSVDDSGCRIDGIASGNARLSELELGYHKPVTVRIGNKPGALHPGGINLFGKRFGNYPQDLILRIRYKIKTNGQIAAAVQDLIDTGKAVRKDSK